MNVADLGLTLPKNRLPTVREMRAAIRFALSRPRFWLYWRLRLGWILASSPPIGVQCRILDWAQGPRVRLGRYLEALKNGR
tara:strand:- start:2692 stop:2934 length:243 start_codon:yes stop_codon:yes gene_type:complete